MQVVTREPCSDDALHRRATPSTVQRESLHITVGHAVKESTTNFLKFGDPSVLQTVQMSARNIHKFTSGPAIWPSCTFAELAVSGA